MRVRTSDDMSRDCQNIRNTVTQPVASVDYLCPPTMSFHWLTVTLLQPSCIVPGMLGRLKRWWSTATNEHMVSQSQFRHNRLVVPISAWMVVDWQTVAIDLLQENPCSGKVELFFVFTVNWLEKLCTFHSAKNRVKKSHKGYLCVGNSGRKWNSRTATRYCEEYMWKTTTENNPEYRVKSGSFSVNNIRISLPCHECCRTPTIFNHLRCKLMFVRKIE